MEQYLYFLHPTRENFVQTITEEEHAIIDEHFAYLQEMLAEGKLFIAGRTLTDSPVGICIYSAESLDQAQQIAQNDPAVVKGVFHAEVHPYNIALMKGQV